MELELHLIFFFFFLKRGPVTHNIAGASFLHETSFSLEGVVALGRLTKGENQSWRTEKGAW